MNVQYVTNEKGKRIAVLLPIDQWQIILEELGVYGSDEETAEILADSAFLASIAKGREQARKREGRPLHEVEV